MLEAWLLEDSGPRKDGIDASENLPPFSIKMEYLNPDKRMGERGGREREGECINKTRYSWEIQSGWKA